MDEINTDALASEHSLVKRYEQRKRNIELLEERISTYVGEVPITYLNQLTEEKRKLAPLRDLLSDSTSLDTLGIQDRLALILARLKRVEQQQTGVVATQNDDWQIRQARQAQQDRFFFEIRLIGYGLLAFVLIVVGLLIALLARG